MVPLPDITPLLQLRVVMERLSAPVSVPPDKVKELTVSGLPVVRFKLPALTVTSEPRLVTTAGAMKLTVAPLKSVLPLALYAPGKSTVPDLNSIVPFPEIEAVGVKVCTPEKMMAALPFEV